MYLVFYATRFWLKPERWFSLSVMLSSAIMMFASSALYKINLATFEMLGI